MREKRRREGRREVCEGIKMREEEGKRREGEKVCERGDR